MKVLAEHRECRRPRARPQMVERAVEERRLGQDRDGGGAGGCVRPRRSPPDRSRGAARPRDGDRRLHSAMTRMPGSPKRGVEQRAARLPGTPAIRCERPGVGGSFSELGRSPGAGDDGVEDAGRHARAHLPQSIERGPGVAARDARRRQLEPSRERSATAPATSSAAAALSSTMSRRGPRLAGEELLDHRGVFGRGAAGEFADRDGAADRRRPDARRTC